MEKKFLTSTVIIIFQNKVLLHKHKKYGIWLPVGGHIETGESPSETAIREAKEESGIDIVLFNPDLQVNLGDAIQLPRPMYIIGKPNKKNYDFVFFATSNSSLISAGQGESNNLKWFELDELDRLNTNPNVIILCKKALSILGN